MPNNTTNKDFFLARLDPSFFAQAIKVEIVENGIQGPSKKSFFFQAGTGLRFLSSLSLVQLECPYF